MTELHDDQAIERSTLDRVASELAVRNVIAQLAHHADSGSVDAYLELLTDDVVWDMPANPTVGLAGSVRTGHDEVRSGIRQRTEAGVQGVGSDTVHVVTTVWVELDGDSARSESTFLFYGSASTEPTLRSMGHYVDELRRTPDGWKLSRRTITFGGR